MEENDEPVIGAFVEAPPPLGPAADAQVARLKAALAATVEGMDPDAIAGQTLEDVVASFAALRAAREQPGPALQVPAGAPGRLTPGPLTPFEKIRQGLARLGS